MIRALPAGRSPGTTVLGVVGAVFLAVGLGGCPGTLDASVLNAARSDGGGAGGGGGGGTPCNRDMAMAALGTYMCSQASCHSAAIKTSGFDMETAGWETNLVGMGPGSASVSCAAGGPYLIAGSNPARGLFIDKIAATQSCGTAMPYPGTTHVAAADVACIQSWANTLTASAGTGGGTGNNDAGGGQ